MTVAELIARLESFSREATARVDDGNEEIDIEDVYVGSGGTVYIECGE